VLVAYNWCDMLKKIMCYLDCATVHLNLHRDFEHRRLTYLFAILDTRTLFPRSFASRHTQEARCVASLRYSERWTQVLSTRCSKTLHTEDLMIGRHTSCMDVSHSASSD